MSGSEILWNIGDITQGVWEHLKIINIIDYIQLKLQNVINWAEEGAHYYFMANHLSRWNSKKCDWEVPWLLYLSVDSRNVSGGYKSNIWLMFLFVMLVLVLCLTVLFGLQFISKDNDKHFICLDIKYQSNVRVKSLK